MWNIDQICDLVLKAIQFIDDYELQYKIIQSLAHTLEDNYLIPRDDLRAALLKIGFILEEFCVCCNERMVNFRGNGNPVCNDCKLDNDSVG
jgi:hypothetical protein